MPTNAPKHAVARHPVSGVARGAPSEASSAPASSSRDEALICLEPPPHLVVVSSLTRKERAGSLFAAQASSGPLRAACFSDRPHLSASFATVGEVASRLSADVRERPSGRGVNSGSQAPHRTRAPVLRAEATDERALADAGLGADEDKPAGSPRVARFRTVGLPRGTAGGLSTRMGSRRTTLLLRLRRAGKARAFATGSAPPAFAGSPREACDG